jgi:hypothetical protein
MQALEIRVVEGDYALFPSLKVNRIVSIICHGVGIEPNPESSNSSALLALPEATTRTSLLSAS